MQAYRAAALVALVLAGPALAADPPGAYFQIGAGFNFLEGTKFSNSGGTAVTESQLNFDIGPAVTGSVGYGFGNGWRAEFEFGYRNNPAHDLTVLTGAGPIKLQADADAYSFFGNLIYAFDLSAYGYDRLSPHVGGGIGAVNLQPTRAPASTVVGGQAIIGVEWAYTNLSLGLDYRYIGTRSADFSFTQNAIAVGRTVNTAYNDHSVLFTWRMRF